MKISRTSALTVLVATAVSIASIGTAQASDPNAPAETVSEQIAAVAPEADGEPILAVSTPGIDSEIPENPEHPVTISSTEPGVPDLAVTLPDLEGTGTALQADDGTVVYMSDSEVSLAVQKLSDGATRFLAVLESPDAPTRYEYRFEDTELQLEQDGSATASLEGQAVGKIDAPWAYDANGEEVLTYYEVYGDTLTQIVDHTDRDYAYPIVADPKFSATWWNTTIHFNKSETRRLGNYQVSLITLLSSFHPSIPVKVLSALGSTASIMAGKASSNNKCVKIVIYRVGPPVPQVYGGNEAGGYCR